MLTFINSQKKSINTIISNHISINDIKNLNNINNINKIY